MGPWSKRQVGRPSAAAGCLVPFVIGVVAVAGLFAVPAEPAMGVVLLGGAVGGSLLWRRHLAGIERAWQEQVARETAAHEAELRRRRARREQRQARWRRTADGPVSTTAGLPGRWAQLVQRAQEAARDYRHSVDALDPGEIRSRAAEGLPDADRAAARCEILARRGAELERLLEQARRRVGRRWRGGAQHESPLDAEVARLRARVEEAARLLREQVERLEVGALRAAQLSVTVSVSEARELLDRLDECRHDLLALSAALDELDRVDGRMGSRVDGRAEGPLDSRVDGRMDSRVDDRAEGPWDSRVDDRADDRGTQAGGREEAPGSSRSL